MNKCEICRCNKICDHNHFGFEICNNFIPEDVVEVVKCKDCQNFKEDVIVEGVGWCEEIERGCSADFFCGYGERKNNDNRDK